MALKIGKKNSVIEVEHKGAYFDIELMGASAENKLAEKYTTYNRRTQQEKVDTVGLLAERFKRMCQGWRGIVDEDASGNTFDVECTDDNKRRFAENNFSDAVEVISKAREKADEQSYVEYDNLKNS